MKICNSSQQFADVLGYCERIVGTPVAEECRRMVESGDLKSAAELLYEALAAKNAPLPAAYWNVISACAGQKLEDLIDSADIEGDITTAPETVKDQHQTKRNEDRKASKSLLGRYLNSPLGLGATYFGLIPIFAFVYAFILPDEFYHSNLKNEPSYYEDIYELKDRLRTSITAYLSDIEAAQDYAITGVGVLNYYPESKYFTITIHVDKEGSSCPLPSRALIETMHDENCTDEKIYFCYLRNYSVVANYFNRLGYALGCDAHKNVTAYNVDEDLLRYLDITVEPYFLQRDYDRDRFSDLTILSYSMDVTAQELKANQRKTDIIELLDGYEWYIDGYQSIPSMNVYLRMTYFSIVTITTLGYGDISPVTNRARLLVGIETLLGILLVGLFLNAITRPDNSRSEKS